MHPNRAFRHVSDDLNIDFTRERGFGTLTISGADGPLLSHIPFLLNEAGTAAELHLVRSNPITQLARQPVTGVISVTGPDSYVSPDWYGAEDQVPTWNYVAVHLCGVLHPLPADHLNGLLDRLSAYFENRLFPKTPWTSDKMSDGVMDRMMRAILPFRFDVQKINGTWKLNQNKPAAVRLAAADHLETYGIGSEIALLSTLMRGAGEAE
ncbi:FMN-binding negative transcriptional regulator [Actibacterium sp. 188UL27-1]|uniref:FMN-binding negative transcriptional regulator n=1 Tax=Actibacterium sp. 188UL27-1 TaxID=2786961 RepID=UPI0019589611|nr:FMN-binding negative transcriptional regulator [Actibacterium sp. 188UL27-1]MBM7069889.1 FMN-binding negative transcriptional regulator [Actibacterium sp. 188UL27-1]